MYVYVGMRVHVHVCVRVFASCVMPLCYVRCAMLMLRDVV